MNGSLPQVNHKDIYMYPFQEMFYLDNWPDNRYWIPVGAYWIYKRDRYQPIWWSYNLKLLLDACDQYGGVVYDNNSNIIRTVLI